MCWQLLEGPKCVLAAIGGVQVTGGLAEVTLRVSLSRHRDGLLFQRVPAGAASAVEELPAPGERGNGAARASGAIDLWRGYCARQVLGTRCERVESGFPAVYSSCHKCAGIACEYGLL